jgi:hypothetical protein
MSESEESLSSILSNSFGGKSPAEPAKGEAAKPAEAAPPAAKEPEAPVEQTEAKPDSTRDEKGRFAKAEEKPAEKPQEKPRPDVAAIIDERRKRQALEAELAKLRQEQTKPAERPSVFENEDAAIRVRMDESNAPMREAIYKLSVKTARTLYTDFDDAAQAFADASERDPRLITGLRSSDDPGEFIYTMGIHVRELADVGGDLMKYRDKVTAASQARIDELSNQLAAMKAENEALKKAQTDLENVPRSLNNTSSGPSPKAGEGNDEDINSIVRFGNQRR